LPSAEQFLPGLEGKVEELFLKNLPFVTSGCRKANESWRKKRGSRVILKAWDRETAPAEKTGPRSVVSAMRNIGDQYRKEDDYES
jgi:hypothetical protein